MTVLNYSEEHISPKQEFSDGVRLIVCRSADSEVEIPNCFSDRCVDSSPLGTMSSVLVQTKKLSPVTFQ